MRNRQTRTSLRWNGIHLPLLIIEEKRVDARVSIGKSSAYLRIPYTAPKAFKHEKLIWAKKWLLETLTEKPEMAQRWKNKEYHSGQEIKTVFKTFVLELKTNQARAKGTVHIKGNQLILALPKLGEEEYYTRDFVATLISKGISADVLPAFSERVHGFNLRYFNGAINQIKLKYLHSRWGSCAYSGNLNFSSKLLLAPTHIMDHIIIHELAHLKEMNHGPRFWKWVAKADPDYRTHEAWLHTHGDKLDF
jgi:predicted metal-dependent hydrolase